MATVKKANITVFRKRTRKKLGRHKKYRGPGYKQYRGQGK